ncbi:hypothetical protein Esti_000374 [Eimeria stiedai]
MGRKTLSNEDGAFPFRGEASKEERRGGSTVLSCPVHGVYIQLREVGASAELSSPARRLVTHKGLVYDVTDFQHPGGSELLEPYFGRDITEAFADVGHTRFAEEMLQTLCVGILREQEEGKQTGPQTRACTCSCNENSTNPTAETPNSSAVRKRTLQRNAATAAAAGGGRDMSSTDEGEGSEPCEKGSWSGAGAKNKQQQQQQKRSSSGAHEVIDFSKPLVPQVYAMNGEDYKKAVASHCRANIVFRLLPWDLLEPATKTYWWVVPLVWLPVACALGVTAYQRVGLSPFVGAAAFGFGVWTLLEYVLHRFLFHFPEDKLPDWGWARVVHFLLHAVHHMLPMDPLRLVVPPALLLLLSIPVLSFFLFIFPLQALAQAAVAAAAADAVAAGGSGRRRPPCASSQVTLHPAI